MILLASVTVSNGVPTLSLLYSTVISLHHSTALYCHYYSSLYCPYFTFLYCFFLFTLPCQVYLARLSHKNNIFGREVLAMTNGVIRARVCYQGATPSSFLCRPFLWSSLHCTYNTSQSALSPQPHIHRVLFPLSCLLYVLWGSCV